MRRPKELLSDEEEKDSKRKLRVNAAFFQNNFARAHWLPSDFLTELRNWHSPMIREWSYRGHTRAGQPVGLTECLPRRYSFIDILRRTSRASDLPPSFHRMVDLTPEYTKTVQPNKDLRDLVRFASEKLDIETRLLNDAERQSEEFIKDRNHPFLRDHFPLKDTLGRN